MGTVSMGMSGSHQSRFASPRDNIGSPRSAPLVWHLLEHTELGTASEPAAWRKCCWWACHRRGNSAVVWLCMVLSCEAGAGHSSKLVPAHPELGHVSVVWWLGMRPCVSVLRTAPCQQPSQLASCSHTLPNTLTESFPRRCCCARSGGCGPGLGPKAQRCLTPGANHDDSGQVHP